MLTRIGSTDRARVRGGLVLGAGCLVSVAPTPSLAWALVPLAVVGAAAVQVESAATGIIQVHAPDRVRAGVLGVTDTAMVAAAMAGAFLAPLAVEAVGARVVLVATGVLCAAACAAVRRRAPLVDVVRPWTSRESIANAEDLHTGSPV